MPVAWRIVKAQYALTALDGEGAFQCGGRWNSRGVRVVYASGALSLAVLENLVRLSPPVTARFCAIRVEFDAALVERIPEQFLPGWSWDFPMSTSQSLGDAWARARRSVVLEVPSVLVPVEPNYLINPLHADFAALKVDEPSDFAFDPRLFARA